MPVRGAMQPEFCCGLRDIVAIMCVQMFLEPFINVLIEMKLWGSCRADVIGSNAFVDDGAIPLVVGKRGVYRLARHLVAVGTPSPTGRHCSWICWGSLRDGRSGRAGPHAGAGLAPGAGRAVPQRAGAGGVRRWRGEEGDGGPLGSIRLAAPRDHTGGHPGLLRPPARVAAGPDPGACVGAAATRRGWRYGDKAYHSADDAAMREGESGVRLVPIRQAKMAPNPLDERVGLRRYRKTIEGVNSRQLEAGFMLKVWASLFALRCMNA
jgi:hypothetical protein